jgi:hypothetical protein
LSYTPLAQPFSHLFALSYIRFTPKATKTKRRACHACAFGEGFAEGAGVAGD